MSDIFIVVDVQNDFCAGGALEVPDTESLIKLLNKVIHKAVDLGMLIIFTRDWHPENHSSFKNFGGQWNHHCVANESGSQFHPNLIVPEKCEIVNKGMDVDKDGYSPYENPLIAELVDQPDVKTVYVSGIAFEYCVMATCLDTIKLKKKVVILEPLVRSVSEDKGKLEKYWDELTRAGVVRAQEIDVDSYWT